MILEHALVTTWDKGRAELEARQLLAAMDFKPGAPVPSPAWIELTHTLTKRGPADRARKIVRLEFDRQRVSIAASIDTAGQRKPEVERQLLLALAGALEARLVHQAAPDQALDIWQQALEAGAQERRRRVRNAWIILALLLGLPLLLVLILVLL